MGKYNRNFLGKIDRFLSNIFVYFKGCFQIMQENYDEVNASLTGLINMLRVLQNITINEINFAIKFYLSCDYKQLRILYGQKSSNALFGCVYCRKNLRTRPDFNENLTINRTLLDPIQEDERPPIIDFIDFKDTIIDVLHLFLRTTDILFKLLFNKLTDLDQNNGPNIDQRPHLRIFLDFLKNDCNISNPWYVSRKGDDSIKLRSLNSNEREKIFEKIFEDFIDLDEPLAEDRLKKKNFYFIFPDFPNLNFELENYVWLNFYEIFQKFKTNELGQDFARNLRNLGRAYVELNLNENLQNTLTPYWHNFFFHVEEMLAIHGDISIFSNQPNEKLNEFSKHYYIKHTNRKNTNLEYLKQLIQKRNRFEFFNLNGNINDLPD
jgi:hypothetical protein